MEEDAIEKSRLLHRMSDGNKLTLTICKRSDSDLFDFYTLLIPSNDLCDQPFQVAVQFVRDMFASKAYAI